MKACYWIAIFVAALIAGGCGSASPKEVIVNVNINEKMMVEKLSVTVTRISRRALPPSDPRAKKMDIIEIGLLVMNESKQPLSFKLEEIYLRDDKNNVIQGHPQGGPGSLLMTGRYLAMGDRITGSLEFFISKGSLNFDFYYKPAKLRGKVYRVEIP